MLRNRPQWGGWHDTNTAIEEILTMASYTI